MKQRKSDKYREKEKRCEGRGDEYSPWIRGHEFSSSGKFSRVVNWLCDNVVQLMSNLELYYFFWLIWDESVIEIRSQYALKPLEQTQGYAKFLGYRHPNVRGEDVVMTTDFVVTKTNKNGNLFEVAYCIKPYSKIREKRVKEKIDIEKMYWERKNIQFEVIDETKINEIFAINIGVIYQSYFLDEQSGLLDYEIKELTSDFIKILKEQEFNTKATMECMAKYCGWEIEEVTSFIYFLITHRKIKVDLFNKRINLRNMKLEVIEGK